MLTLSYEIKQASGAVDPPPFLLAIALRAWPQICASGRLVKVSFVQRGNQPVLVRMPAISFVDDNAGKPVGTQEHIGRRPSVTPAAIWRYFSG